MDENISVHDQQLQEKDDFKVILNKSIDSTGFEKAAKAQETDKKGGMFESPAKQ